MNMQLELEFTPRPPPEAEHPDLSVVAWVTQSDLPIARRVDARHWLGWWESLPSYERDRHRAAYTFERTLNDGRLRPFSRVCPEIDTEVLRMEEESVERWAEEIRQAAVEGRPMPFAPCPHMTGFELDAFNSRLYAACQRAGAFIIAPAAPEPQKKGRKA